MESYAYASVQAVTEVVLVASAGAYLVWRGAFPKTAIKIVDKLIVEVFTPCLVLTKVIPHADPSDLAQLWPLVIVCPWNIFWGFVLGWALSRALGKPQLRSVIQAAICFPNTISVCLTLAQALGRTATVRDMVLRQIAANETADVYLAVPAADLPELLVQRASVMILTSAVWWNLSRWTVAYTLLAPEGEATTLAARLRKVFNPPVIACVIAFTIGFIRPAREWWTGGSTIATLVVEAASMLGRCMVPLVMMVLGGRVLFSVIEAREARKARSTDDTAAVAPNGHSDGGKRDGPHTSNGNPLDRANGSLATSIGELSVLGSAMLDIDDNDNGFAPLAETAKPEAEFSNAVVYGIIFCRQCVCAGLGMLLMHVLSQYTNDVMLLIPLYLQAAGPPMINLTVMAGLHGTNEEALARTLMYSYLVSVVTWTVGIACMLQVLEFSIF